MSLAATAANLLVIIEGKDMLTPAAASAEKSITSLGAATVTTGSKASTAEKAFGLVGNAATGMGNALNHAKGFVSNLVSGPLGMIGLGAAAFSLAGALKSGIDTANELAATLEKLHAITGLSDESLSALVAVTDKYGISQQTVITLAAFAEKTIGKLADTMSGKGAAASSKLTQLDKLYGITLVDNTGKAVDFQTELLRVADYYTSNATASQKAALAAQLFGRGYQALIPILSLGSQGIKDAEQAAADLGLTLNATNVQDLQKYQAAMRDAGEAAAGLKLTLAETLIPTLTDLAQEFTKFVTDHRTDIKQFFLGAISAAKTIGSALMQVGQLAKSAWDAIPGPLQTLMLQALIGNKVIKTVFGINIIGTVASAVEGAAGGLIAKAFGSLFGKTIATPVVNVDGAVVNVGGVPGGGGGLATGVGEAAGAGGGVVTALGPGAEVGLLAKLTPVAIGVGVAQAEKPMFDAGWQKLTAMDAKLAAGNGLASQGNALTATGSGVARGTEGLAKLNQSQIQTLKDMDNSIMHQTNLQSTEAAIDANALVKLKGATDSQTLKVTSNQNLMNLLIKSNGKVTYDQLLAMQHTQHEDHLTHMVLVNKSLTKAGQILASNETTRQKITALEGIQAVFDKDGDRATAAKLTLDISHLQGALLSPLDKIASFNLVSSVKDKSSGPQNFGSTTTTTHRSNTGAAGKSNKLGPVAV